MTGVRMTKKDVNITTIHGITVKVEVVNEPNNTYFDCPNWYALCKAYALEDDMKITFDLGTRRRVTKTFRNEEIWMLVHDVKLVLSPREFLKQISLVSFLIASQVDNLIYNCQFMSILRSNYRSCSMLLFLMVDST